MAKRNLSNYQLYSNESKKGKIVINFRIFEFDTFPRLLPSTLVQKTIEQFRQNPFKISQFWH